MLPAKAAVLATAFLFVVLGFVAKPIDAFAQSPLPAAASEPSETAGAGETLPAEHAQALAEALKDEKVRAALIAELERMGGGAEAGATPAAAAEPEEQQSLGRRIADFTRNAVEFVLGTAKRVARQLTTASSDVAAIGGDGMETLIDALLELALSIIVTVTVFVVLRRLATRIYRRIGERAAEANLARTSLYVLCSVAMDAAIVVFAWAAGYAVSLFALGESGVASMQQTLYLNAFFIVEMVKVALRTLLSPSTARLRPIDMPDVAARKLHRWLGVVISLLGYGQLLVVPIVANRISYFTGQGVSVMIALAALIIVTTLVLSSRRAVADWLLTEKGLADGPYFLRSIARGWHLPIVLYLVVLFLIVLTRPGGILLPVLGASGQILAAVLVGALAASGISRAIAKGVSLPQYLTARLPLLERRLNAFVPKALMVIRVLIAFAVITYALDTIDLVNIESWMVSQVGVDLTGVIVSVLFLALASFLVWLAFSSYVDWRLNPDFGSVPTAREQTLLSLGKNAFTIILIAVTFMFILSEIGIDIAPLLASAGVLGLAIGFGAQKMVQDVITGVFIQFENAIDVGDIVQLGGTTGTVERLTIRSVSLRDLHGVFHIIPFSSVDTVSNYTRGFANYVCDMGIAYREDIEEAKQAMFDAFAELRQTEQWGQFILADFDWFGLQAFGDSAIVLRARIRCMPGKQFGVGRAYNAILKRVFDERGIEIPFPHQTIYFGEDKSGAAPPAHVLLKRQDSAGKDGPDAPSSKPADAPEDDHEQQPKHDHTQT